MMSGSGQVRLSNPHLKGDQDDILYHIGLSSASDLKKLFSDVRFVCMGGTPVRMEAFARYIKTELGIELPSGADLYDIAGRGHRYAMFKVGPVLSVSHGMGAPSASILLHEVLKLLMYAECRDVIIIRIGTSGGLGVAPGSVVVSSGVLTDLLEEYHDFHIMGKVVKRPTALDRDLAESISKAGIEANPSFQTVLGKTMSANDFYEAQVRVDGAICEYTLNDKMEFLRKLRDMGVMNIEMESSVFAAICAHVNVRCAIVCVTLLNRLEGDQITATKETLEEWQNRPQSVVCAFIKQQLGLS